jgi:selenocysteine-specific elongation factor
MLFDVRSLVVGTAGHIDHGKSALVRALTGTDPDRLKEEKERGITIDLGFAHLALGDEAVVSFIDVPGHERFVRNMLAGAHGIDAVLLVVAADESVMPQTREHFHICRLLGIPRGIVALTKCDVADAESQALAEMEARELVAGSFLEGARVERVSARTGEGLGALRAALLELARAAPRRPETGLLRIPVDRVFTLRGFGTVVTGTLVSGSAARGDELEALPSGRRTRIRGMEVHGEGVERAVAGTRVALNLAGIDVSDVVRGDVLASPGTLRATSMLDVELSLLPGERPLENQARLRVHLGSAEVLGRVRLPGDELRAGDTAVGQIRLERASVASRGDRLVLRSYSPSVTIGGARVLDPLPPKRRSSDRMGPERAVVLGATDPVRAAALLVAEAGTSGIDAATLAARAGAPATSLVAALDSDPTIVRVGRDGGVLLSRAAADALSSRLITLLEGFHAASPLRPAMPREELKHRLFARPPAGVFEHLLGTLAGAGTIRIEEAGVALARHAVTLGPEELQARETLLEAALAAGLEGIEVARVAEAGGKPLRVLEQVAGVLLAEGSLQRVGEKSLVLRERLETLKADVLRRWPPGSRVDVGGFKEITGLTRRHVIPLLEYLDRERLTRRAGSERFTVSSR